MLVEHSIHSENNKENLDQNKLLMRRNEKRERDRDEEYGMQGIKVNIDCLKPCYS